MYGIVPAAGSGSRMGGLARERSKILLPLTQELPALCFTVRALVQAEVLRGLVVVTRAEDVDEIHKLLAPECSDLELMVAPGGATRQESVACGLKAVEGRAEFVLVHDAARPLCPVAKIREVADTARKTGAALLATPVKSTLKRVGSDGTVEATVPRGNMWAAQTPQVFSYDVLCRAHAEADGHLATDDCELVERLGHPVTVVEGAEQNIKLTTPHDLELARVFLTG